MRRSLAITALLGGCAYFGDGSDPVDPPDDDPPVGNPLPAGVWEPVPGASIIDARLAADNGNLWWALLRREGDGSDHKHALWLGETSSSGASLVAPTQVVPTSVQAFQPDVVVTPSAVVVKFAGGFTSLRRYDHAGKALGEPYPIVIANGGVAVPYIGQTELVPTSDGGAQLVAALNQYEMAEAAIVGFDANGAPTTTAFVGTPDTFELIRSSAYGIAAATRPDGSTLVAWDRNYVECAPVRPSSTFASAVTGTTVGAIQPVGDMPDVGADGPSIAASGDTAYITWHIDTGNRRRAAFAKFPDVASPLVEIGDPNGDNYEATVALAAPGRGAIMYRSGAFDGTIHVVAFADSAGGVQLGVPRVLPRVIAAASSMTSVGLVHVGDDRYVVGWIEYFDDEARLYATEIDLDHAMMRPAPPFERGPAPTVRATRARPCI